MKKLTIGSKTIVSLVLCSSFIAGAVGCSSAPSDNDKKDNKKNKYIMEEEPEDSDDSDDSGDSDSENSDASDAGESKDKDSTKTSDADSDGTSKYDESMNSQYALIPNSQKTNDEIISDISGNLVSENPVKISIDEPESFDPLTPKNINGNWVDDNGIFMKIDGKENKLIDAYGNRYTINEVLDDGLVLRYNSSYFLNDNWKCNYILPLPLEFFMPMYLDGDTLTIGEMVLSRADSNEGKAKLDAIYDELVNGDFKDYGGDVYFKDNGKGFFASTKLDDWEYRDGILTVDIIYDMTYDFMLRKTSDGCFYLINDGMFVFDFYDKKYDDESWFYGDYISWDCESKLANFCVILPQQISYTSMDQTSSKTSDFSLTPNGGFCTLPLHDAELYLYQESCIPCMSTSYDVADAMALFVRRDSIFGQLFLYREDIINGFIENNIEPEVFSCKSDKAKMTVTFPDLDCTWKSDYVGVNFSTFSDDIYMIPFDDEFDPIADVCVKDDVDYVITAEIKVSEYLSPDQYYLKQSSYSCDYFNSSDDTLIGDGELSGDILTITHTDNSNYTYEVVVDKTSSATMPGNTNGAKVIPDEIAELPDSMTIWANTCYTGDILDLVDINYISNSIVAEDGTAIFWVSTVEELASATFFINSLDMERGNSSTMFYIHLLNDIDLEGYNWVSLGSTYQINDDYQHMFQGVIFGNGYAIKNLYIEDPSCDTFLSNCHLATVIGLTLENPKINVNTDATKYILIDDNSCITEVFDTKVVFDKDFEYCYEFSESGNDSLNYFDCSFISVDSSTGATNDIGLNDDYVSFYYNGNGNWIYDYYTRSGDYSYDAKSEYADYLKDSSAFIDGSYYALDKNFVPSIGYLDIEGWYDGTTFYTEFGYSDW